MIRNDLIRKIVALPRNIITVRSSSSNLSLGNIEKLENEQSQEVIEDDPLKNKEDELELKRNKSRLKDYHRRFLMEQNPYLEPTFSHHGTLKYLRRTYGRYGEASGVNPAICFPVKQELEDALEYERIKYPYTIPDMIQKAKQQKEEKQRKVLERQTDIVNKMKKLDQWKKELHDRIAKRENEAMEAKLRKERLVEEVRRHFGYTVDPRDEKFKELLEKKEKEQKKAMKEARKKAKQEKVIEKLLKKNESNTAEPPEFDQKKVTEQ